MNEVAVMFAVNGRRTFRSAVVVTVSVVTLPIKFKALSRLAVVVSVATVTDADSSRSTPTTGGVVAELTLTFENSDIVLSVSIVVVTVATEIDATS